MWHFTNRLRLVICRGPGAMYRMLCSSSLFVCIHFLAGGQKPLSLQECVRIAFENRPDIQDAQLTLMYTKAQIKEGYSAYLPQVSASFTLDDNLKLLANVIPGGVLGPEPVVVRFGTTYAAFATGLAEQKIYDQSLITGFKAFKPSLEAAVENIEKMRQEVAMEVATVYVQAAVLTLQIEPLEEIRKEYKKLLSIVELQAKEGFALSTDVERLRLALSNVEAQWQLLIVNREMALQKLKASMWVPETEPIIPDTASIREMFRLQLTAPPFDPLRLPELRLLRKNIDIQKIQMMRVKHGYIPNLSAYARYGVQALNNQFGPLWSRWFDFSSVGLRISFPVFDGFWRQSRYSQARIQWLQMQNQYKHSERLLKLQFENATLARKQSAIDVLQQEQTLQLARRVLLKSQAAFAEGRQALAEVLNAEIQFQQAMINYHNALLMFLNAEIQLQKAAGRLLEYLKVR
ncbi:MAG: TolC family protein [Flavobacteriales bacterium]|nr:TolC family protein [Flavobacteriales bacterium]MCX7768410.1 TolC family protein [Flavobacteriales bacterium]MDW8409697.1 TolC family protein [Flavobacteriales bacterium]